MFLHYLKIAIRNMLHHKWQTALNILGLAVGFVFFSCWMFLFAQIDPTAHTYSGIERSYTIYGKGEMVNYMDVERSGTRVTMETLRQQIPQIEEMTSLSTLLLSQLKKEDREDAPLVKIKMQVADTNFFSYHDISILPGNLKNYRQLPDLLLFTDAFARKTFGRENPVGRSVYISGKAYTIGGLIEPASVQTVVSDVYLMNASDEEFASSPLTSLEVKIQKGSSAEDFLQNLSKIQEQDSKGEVYVLKGRQDMALDGNNTSMIILKAINIAVASLLLLSALFNYISFTLSLFFKRVRECGIRKVAGSSRKQLFGLFFVEVLVGLSVAFLFSFVIIELILPFLESRIYTVTMFYFPFEKLVPQMCLHFLWGILLACLLCIPVVWRINRMSDYSAIAGTVSREKIRNRSLLIGAQLFVSILIVSFSCFFYFQVEAERSAQLKGLTEKEKSEILTFSVDELSLVNPQLAEPSLQKIRGLSGVAATTVVNQGSLTVAGNEENHKQSAIAYSVDREFPSVFSYQATSGRFLKPDETAEIVLSESLAKRLYPGVSALGQTITAEDGSVYMVVGLVSDDSFMDNLNRFVFISNVIPSGDKTQSEVYARINSEQFQDTRKQIRQIMKPYEEINPDFKVRSLEEKIKSDRNYIGISLILDLAALMTIVCLVLSFVGIYSSVALKTEHRRREVAIRKVNGALFGDIFRMFIRSYLIILVVSWVLASILSYFIIGAILNHNPYQHPYQPGVLFYLTILLSMIGILVLTVYYKIWEVARANPADVVKCE